MHVKFIIRVTTECQTSTSQLRVLTSSDRKIILLIDHADDDTCHLLLHWGEMGVVASIITHHDSFLDNWIAQARGRESKPSYYWSFVGGIHLWPVAG